MRFLLTREVAEDYLKRWVTEIGPAYVGSLGRTYQAKDGVDYADIIQIAGMRFLSYVGKLVHKPMSLLCTIAKNLVTNLYRRRAHEVVSIAFPDEIADYRQTEAECRDNARDARLRLAKIRRACPRCVRTAQRFVRKAEGDIPEAAKAWLEKEGILSPTVAQMRRRKKRIEQYLFRARQYAPPEYEKQQRCADKAA